MASKSVSNNRSNSRQLVGVTRGEIRTRGRLVGFEWCAVLTIFGSAGDRGPVITGVASIDTLTGDARRKANRWIDQLAPLTKEMERKERARIEAMPKMLTRSQLAMVKEHRQHGEAVAKAA